MVLRGRGAIEPSERPGQSGLQSSEFFEVCGRQALQQHLRLECQREVDTLAASLSVPEAVVVDDAGRRVGLVSRTDALLWKTEGGHGGERLDERVSDASLAVVHPDDITAQAIDRMLATDQGRLPVTDSKTGILVGLLTRKDLLQVRAAVARSERERRAYFVGGRRASRAEAAPKSPLPDASV